MNTTISTDTRDKPVIELINVSKTFGEVKSLSQVDFKVYPSEIVGLLGDNGAGKSTLVKTVMGFHVPDKGGEIYFKGDEINDWSVSRARSLGIETVYQERALCEKQSIWRNMFIGRELRNSLGLLDVKKMRSESEKLMKEHMRFTSTAVHPDNTVDVNQSGAGAHYMDITLGTGSYAHDVDISQTGTGNHAGRVNLDGYATDFDLTQQGSTSQTYDLDMTCGTANGCAVSTTQGN